MLDLEEAEAIKYVTILNKKVNHSVICVLLRTSIAPLKETDHQVGFLQDQTVQAPSGESMTWLVVKQ